ncbi:MAG: lectin-like protein [Pirellulales bacterium]
MSIATFLAGVGNSVFAGGLYWAVDAGGNGHIYDRVERLANFDTALADAASRTVNGVTGHLVTITSAAESDFVYQVSSHKSGNWIGLARPSSSGDVNDFQWVTGEPVSYTNWFPGAPNNPAGDKNNVGTFDTAEWTNVQYWQLLSNYLVEYESTAKVHHVPLSFQATGATTLSIQTTFGGIPAGSPVVVPLTGSLQTELYYTNPTHPVGISVFDVTGIAPPSFGGSLDMGALGSIEFTVADATANLVQPSASLGHFLIVDDAGQVRIDELNLKFPTGIASYALNPPEPSFPPGTLGLDFFGTLDVGKYSTANATLTTSPTAVPGIYSAHISLPVVVDLPFLGGAGLRVTVNVDAIGEFQAVPEPTTLAMALCGFAVSGLVLLRRQRRGAKPVDASTCGCRAGCRFCRSR